MWRGRPASFPFCRVRPGSRTSAGRVAGAEICDTRHLCRKLGFREYGPFPKACRRDGELVDVAGLSLTPDRLHADWTASSSSHRGGAGAVPEPFITIQPVVLELRR